MAQIVSEELKIPLSRIDVLIADTEKTPYAPASGGSQTTPSVSPAARAAAAEAAEKLIERTAKILDTSVENITRVFDGFQDTAQGKTWSWDEITSQIGEPIETHGARAPNPPMTALNTFGANFAEVEVDIQTGKVKVLKIVAVHDVGRILNPLTATSQVYGGVIQALGFALSEERIVDNNIGKVVNPSMLEYQAPSLLDIPEIEVIFVDKADLKISNTGARGLGEPPIISTAPAIANAVYDAIGMQITTCPLIPARVLNALKEVNS